MRLLAATCGAGVCLLTGCAPATGIRTDADVGTDTRPAMTLTVSAETDEPTTVWFDTRQRNPSGLQGEGVDATPVELSPQRPAVVLPVPYEHGNWLWARVAGPPGRPAATVVRCELRSAAGAVVDVDASDPLGPPPGEAACAGAA
ncbi:hypothetical protein GCM10023201_16030 [Actinomycetospora corticicola]|uniref:Secreted protein n=1 Tax=Actinomycetospora corticicola TaxID=663602 RepID=A0A7Y9J5Z1_9PSEU|nr:hypothetical protein [Actinomycetospora corticicola]NYD36039.1 hypothetical protein [Actinomycetospora corticicola]